MARQKRRNEEDGQEHLAQLLGDEEVQPLEFDGKKSFQFFKIEKEE